ncbi:MAG: c-type cytochrome [Nitriliruptorales bacterium]|nr:c-type cytochrome [Nitriliruptorales bacterium]
MFTNAIAIGILVLAGILVIVLLTTNANRRRRRLEDVPPGMRPAYSDEELERSVLERYMQWGMVLTVGLALFFPLYWLNESRRLNSETQDFFVEAVVRGEEQYQANCAECHAPDMGGGAAPSPYSDSSWPVPALNNIATRYAENRNVTDVQDFIIQTLQRGRPGTPMPTWGGAYGGPMTDQQIEDITAYILANQVEEVTEATAAANVSGEELYVGNCAKCHGEDLEGVVGPSLIGVTERHSPEDILGILTSGILMPTGVVMPGFSEQHYMYEDARYTEDALRRLVTYLQERQPAQLPESAGQYQTPGEGQQAALDSAADGGGGGDGEAADEAESGAGAGA